MAKSAAKVRRIGRGYADLRDHIEALERAGLLVRVRRLINKDTEMHPLVRWQYRGGLPEKDWRGFLFENVTGVKGKHYDIPVAVGVMAGSKYIVAVGLDCDADGIADKWQKAFRSPIEPMMVKNGPVHQVVLTGADVKRSGGLDCDADGIADKWQKAFRSPIEPMMVKNGPVHQVVLTGADVKRSGGLDQFPVPISTPGFDGAPFITAGHWITKDPDTGIRNVGNYRGHLKAKDRLGIFPGPGQHVLAHWQKCKAKGIPLQAAVVVGPPPVVSYAAAQKVPYGVDEPAVAGAPWAEPIRLVKCKPVDIEVPADAEIVIEGVLATDTVEPEGPFGESHGYMHPRMMNPFMQVTAITRKKNPILVSWTSQVTPSESDRKSVV